MRIGRRGLWLALPFLVFCLLCLPFVPLLGLQDDEALFAPAVYPERCGPAFSSVEVGGRQWPIMLMSYVGAPKALLYRVLFGFTPPSLWNVRLVGILFASAAVVLVAAALFRKAGATAAVVAAILLATDPTLVLTSTFDWGPVALQHFLIALAVFAFLRDGRPLWAGIAGLACGLAVWNKAIALWFLAPLALLAWPWQRAGLRRVSAFVLGGLVGAAPLLLFNIREPLRTFTENTRFEPVHLAWKLAVLRDTLAAQGMGDYFFYPASTAAAPQTSTVLLPLWLLAIMLAAVMRESGTLRVTLVTLLAWAAMVMTGGGGSVHHTVLLWPGPQVAVALLAARCAGTPAALRVVAAIALLAAGQNLRVLHGYQGQALERGGNKGWTDAASALPTAIARQPSSRVYALDWGIRHSLCLLAPVRVDILNEQDQPQFDEPTALYVRSLHPFVFQPGTWEAIRSAAERSGRRAVVLETVRDSHGREAFEVLRLK